MGEDNKKLLKATQINTAAIMATDRLMKEWLGALHEEVIALRELVAELQDRLDAQESD